MARGFAAALILFAALCGPARAAEILVDLEADSVLLAHEADAPRRPASLVKMMTAYLAFEALSAGEIEETTPVTISGHAARQPPVKLGLRKGESVPFGELLQAAIIGSKNDAATAIAEAVAGSEAEFVTRMNAAAEKLGMVNTRYANATGLPANGQQTTARDIALLARALLDEYPERAKLFARRAASTKGRRVSTTNPLFGRVEGAIGMKTGFTCAAGYSIAGLVEKDGRRVLAVTLGHASKGARLIAVKKLLAAAPGIRDGSAKLDPGTVQDAALPDMRACSGRGQEIAATDVPLPLDADLYLAGVSASAQRDPEPIRPAIKEPEPVAALPARPATRPEPPPPLGGWGVFLGAHDSEANARGIASSIRRRALPGAGGHIHAEQRGRDAKILSVIYNLDRRTAGLACAAARQTKDYCLVLSPERLLNSRARWRR